MAEIAQFETHFLQYYLDPSDTYIYVYMCALQRRLRQPQGKALSMFFGGSCAVAFFACQGRNVEEAVVREADATPFYTIVDLK